MQPNLDAIERWTRKWKVELSVNKCCYTVFTTDPAESNGKRKPNITLRGEALKYESTPTFLGITFDGQLTFRAHAEKIKAEMAKRRKVLQALSGKSYSCDKKTLRTAI